MSRGYRKPGRPALNKANGLCRGLLWAYCGGWQKGYGVNNRDAVSEDINVSYGTWQPSVGSAHTDTQAAGAGIDGDGSSYLEFAVPQSRYNITRGFSLAVLLGEDDPPDATAHPIINKRNPAEAATDAGWNLETSSGNQYNFEWSDGVAQTGLTATTAFANRSNQLVVVTHDLVTAKLYIDGVLEDSVASTRPVGNNTLPLRVCGNNGPDVDWDGVLYMGGVWNRPLAASEIERLWSDPYIMWRHSLHKEFMFGPGMAPVGGLGTYFLIF